MFGIIVTVVIIAAIFITILALISRYKRCPSDKLLVIYGAGAKKDESASKVIHGGAAFIIPVLQAYEYLDLKPIPISVGLKNALSKQNIRISVPSTFTVAISPEPGLRENAAEKLLGLSKEEIARLAEDIIFGQMRLVIATMDIEEINNNRDKFLENISKNLEGELTKIGLKLINVNVQDIEDESGYIEALGKEAASQAINDAKKVVAEKDRDGSIGQAEAKKEERVQVADANSLAEIGEATADRNLRVEKSARDADAVAGENSAAIKIADSNSEKKVRQSEALKKATIAEKTNTAKSLEEGYKAEKIAEDTRAEKDKATEYANIVVPAEIGKQKIEIEAEAEAEKTRRIEKGKADGILFNMEAEAEGIKKILSKSAEGIKEYVEAAGGSPVHAVMLMLTDKLPELYKIQTDAIKNIKFDKVTVWDSGSGNGKKGSSTSDWMQNILKTVPGFKDVYASIGEDLPKLLQSAQDVANAEKGKSTTTIETTEVDKSSK